MIDILINAAALIALLKSVGDSIKESPVGQTLEVPMPEPGGPVLRINGRRVRLLNLAIRVG